MVAYKRQSMVRDLIGCKTLFIFHANVTTNKNYYSGIGGRTGTCNAQEQRLIQVQHVQQSRQSPLEHFEHE